MAENFSLRDSAGALDGTEVIPCQKGGGIVSAARTTPDAIRTYIDTVLASRNIRFTDEGGVAFKLINRTGVDSVKGEAINISQDYDNSYIVATEPYTVNGYVYESGILMVHIHG